MKHTFSAAITLAALIAMATGAAADETFDIAWSGASFSNTAQATGTITLDPSLLLPSGYTDLTGFFFPPAIDYVSALSITVTGASSGDGTFGLIDFDTVLFDQNGGALDFTSQLIGQPTVGDLWGTPSGLGGDFNVFNRTQPGLADAPDGSFNFTLVTNDGSGDSMLLTSFAPAISAPAGTPEPGVIALLGGLGAAGACLVLRRRKARLLAPLKTLL